LIGFDGCFSFWGKLGENPIGGETGNSLVKTDKLRIGTPGPVFGIFYQVCSDRVEGDIAGQFQ